METIGLLKDNIAIDSITKQSAHGNAFKVFNFYLRSTNFTNINFIEDLS